MCEFTETMVAMKEAGQWKSYPDGSIFDVYGNEILPKAEITTKHHRFVAMPPKSIEHLAHAGDLVLT